MHRMSYLLAAALVLCSGVWSVQAQACTAAEAEQRVACDDGIFCNGSDVCDFKVIGVAKTPGCFLHTGDPCVSGDECKTKPSCNESSDTCSYADNGPCTPDASECTADLCSGGACTHPSLTFGIPCSNDGNPCTDDFCNGAGTCAHTNNALTCDDDVFCNGPDTCSQGSCVVHAGNPCETGPECANACNEDANSCNLSPKTPCGSDDNDCTDDECDGLGVCAHVPNTDPCDDSLFCNGEDSCGGGGCSFHNGDPCAGGEECSQACDEDGDQCVVPTGIPCTDDSNPCTDDLCMEGGCVHEFISGCEVCTQDADCDDSNACTVDACEVDGCTNVAASGCVPCALDGDCDDGDACTVDRCADTNQCVYANTDCFAAITCSFITGLSFDACDGERIPGSVVRLIDRAGCSAEQAEVRARKGVRPADKKLKSGKRSIDRAAKKVLRARSKAISTECADTLSEQLTGLGGTFATLMDKPNEGARLTACTDAVNAPDATPQLRAAPSLCTKR